MAADAARIALLTYSGGFCTCFTVSPTVGIGSQKPEPDVSVLGLCPRLKSLSFSRGAMKANDELILTTLSISRHTSRISAGVTPCPALVLTVIALDWPSIAATHEEHLSRSCSDQGNLDTPVVVPVP